jgi:hypothetical protein
MGKSQLNPRPCANPNCQYDKGSRAIINPYNSNHKVCDDPICKIWLQNQSRRKKNTYRFNIDFVDKWDHMPGIAAIRFTKDDIEKIEE